MGLLFSALERDATNGGSNYSIFWSSHHRQHTSHQWLVALTAVYWDFKKTDNNTDDQLFNVKHEWFLGTSVEPSLVDSGDLENNHIFNDVPIKHLNIDSFFSLLSGTSLILLRHDIWEVLVKEVVKRNFCFYSLFSLKMLVSSP